MNKVKWSGALHSVALLALTACVAAPAMAYDQRGDNIFSRIEPSLRDRAFMRLNYVHATVKTTSGDAYDVTGPVVGRNDIAEFLGEDSGYQSMFYRGGNGQPGTDRIAANLYDTIQTALTGTEFFGELIPTALDRDLANGGCESTAKQGLGTPCGIKAKSSSTLGTPALSVGYYLDEGMNWLAEAFLLAAPLKAEVYGVGQNSLAGQRIIDLKLLPPTAVLGRYFGAKDSRIRPFAGLGASYAIFFDVRATDTLNTYQGGPTTISVKNALGFGPFFGVKAQIDDDWHVSLNIGKLRYKTEATLVTRNTRITADSAVIRDYGLQTSYVNTTGISDTLGGGQNPSTGGPNSPITVAPAQGGIPQVAGFPVGAQVAPLTALMCDLARAKYGNNECNHGTFVRKQKTKLDNTLFMFSVGRSF